MLHKRLCKHLLSDQGRSFESDIIKEICTILEISNDPLPPKQRITRTLQDMDKSDASVLHTIPVSSQQKVSPSSTSCMVAKWKCLGSPNPHQVKQSCYSAQLKQSLDAYTKVRERPTGQRYDKKVHGKAFERGDRVWLHCPAVLQGSPSKLHTPCSRSSPNPLQPHMPTMERPAAWGTNLGLIPQDSTLEGGNSVHLQVKKQVTTMNTVI